MGFSLVNDCMFKNDAITVFRPFYFFRCNFPSSPTSFPIDSTEEPIALKLIQSCLEEHDSYCINGLCAFHNELKKPICRCLTGYSGERCEHLTLNSYALNSYERYIAVGIGAGMLLSGIIALIYCYVRKRCGKLKSPYKV
ncbi:epigen [Caretta caretta]|uniref:epigen n=1 Tax=Caretta caretta TaxID=8467 RepID=UPI0020953C63|nr:epigen [Caretta caretta]